jgi:type II secretory pathway component PulF
VPASWLKGKAAGMLRRIENGQNWIKSLKKARFINGPEASLLESAERTGNTPAVLGQLALTRDRKQIRKDDLVGKLVFLPCIFGFSVVIGFVVIALFLPMVKLITDMSHLI